MLPFTHEQFLAVFAAYNTAVWPAQPVAYLLGLAACAALAWRPRSSGRLVAGVLAVGWLWTGMAYHLFHFSTVNPAAVAFGVLFLVQGVLFVSAARRRSLRFRAAQGWRGWAGWTLVVYAMVFYPLLGLAAGARYPELPMFGITPCPLALFTFGILLLASGRIPWSLLVVPGAWSVIGGSAAFLLDVPQDGPLLFLVLLVPVLALRPAQPARARLAGAES